MAQQHLRLAEEEEAAVGQREVEAAQDPGLGLAVEVHEGVAADEEVDPGDRRVLHQVVAAEDHRPAELLVKDVVAGRPLEVLLDVRSGDLLHVLRAVRRLPGLVQRFLVDVGGVDLDPAPELLHPELLGQQDRHRIRLFSGGTAGAPHPDRPRRTLARDDPGHDLLCDVLPGGLVAKECRHVDQDRVEQARELLGMDLEVVDVVCEIADADDLHPLLDAAHQGRALVGREVEAAGPLQVVEEAFEFGRRLGVSHPASPVATSVARADGISLRGSTKSTAPVAMAELGIPKKSLVASSWAMTVPPIFLMAWTPIVPSLPVPVRTTAIARCLKLAATDSKSRSADGRTKWTSSVWASDSEPSGFTSRCLFGGAM